METWTPARILHIWEANEMKEVCRKLNSFDEVLAALKGMVEMVEKDSINSDDLPPTMNARAAIEKAGG